MIKLNEMVRKTAIDGEMVLLDAKSGAYYGLNEVGSRMVELALQLSDNETIIKTITEEFDAEESLIRDDFAELMDTLLKKELIVDREA
ncbi:MAG: PqqD family protein [Spirochaetia bacterium]|nr:PqqD family protein [Spirochaetia bacterium]